VAARYTNLHIALIIYLPFVSSTFSINSTETPPREQVRVVAAVIQRDCKLLICLRPADKRHGGLWEFPGGKVNNGETDSKAVARELSEELGVETLFVGAELFSVADAGSVFEICFLQAEIEGEPAPLEHDELAWASPSDLLSYDLAPSDRKFAAFLVGGGS